MLDDGIRTQLSAYLERVTQPVELIASLDGSDAARDMRELLTQIAALAPDRITARFDGSFDRRPSFQVTRAGHDMGVHFAALPMGHEFTSLVLALLWAGGHPPKVDAAVLEQVRALPGTHRFETFMSLSCHNCPDVVQALHLMAVINPGVTAVAIDGALFQAEVESREILAVPSVLRNGEAFGSGRMELAEILARLDSGTAQRAAEQLSTREPYDVLIVGGGPAGAAAAVYAARKGIRTALVAERFGGQTLDTLGIENYPSVLETEGPAFAASLEAQVRRYGVDLVTSQRVARVEPADQPGDAAEVQLESGAVVRGRTVVLAPGARWRSMGVPGEQEYRTRGVAYCPHCDGPLFKGKDVAVIGGGNSGVEAAIDLAGVVRSVTLLEFADRLRADQVLVDKLRSLPNQRVHLNAQTTEVTGDGRRMDGLLWTDRVTGESHRLDVAGVFVQIGLVPNTEFLKGTVELNRFGEIVVDAKGHTSAPGLFAAGDATTVPYKQIVVATGEGAKAALSAFDHLIRLPQAA